MIRFLRLSLLVVTLTTLFISCNQDPTSVGSNLISEQDKFTFKQLNSEESNLSQSTSFFVYKPKLGGSDYLLLGKTSSSESLIMLRYSLVLNDSTISRVNNGQLIIKEVWMTMVPRNTVGSATASFDFSAHQIRSAWTEVGFDRDSIPNLSFDATNVKTSLAVTDTTVKFSLNPSVVKEWFKILKDNTAPKNYGLLLKPSASSQKILGFLSKDGAELSQELKIILTGPSSFIDTIAISPVEDIHVVTGSVPTSGSNMYLEGGLSLRGNVFFDISSLPKNSIINKAILELNADPSKEIDGTLKSDSLLVQLVSDSTKKVLSDSIRYTLLTRKNNVFSGDAAWMIQRVLNGEKYQGFLITLMDESSSASKIVLYGSKDSNKALRPKLKITYMQKK